MLFLIVIEALGRGVPVGDDALDPNARSLDEPLEHLFIERIERRRKEILHLVHPESLGHTRAFRSRIFLHRFIFMDLLRRLQLDPFTLGLFVVVGIAALLPATGHAADVLDLVTDLAIAALFFMHGAKLSREAVKEGTLHFRLHLTILASTFLLFPILGFGAKPVFDAILSPELALGFLFLAALPSTVQSSIAFTAIAGGNVPAAVVAASLSSLLGVFLTPVLMTVLVGGSTGAMEDPISAILKI